MNAPEIVSAFTGQCSTMYDFPLTPEHKAHIENLAIRTIRIFLPPAETADDACCLSCGWYLVDGKQVTNCPRCDSTYLLKTADNGKLAIQPQPTT